MKYTLCLIGFATAALSFQTPVNAQSVDAVPGVRTPKYVNKAPVRMSRVPAQPINAGSGITLKFPNRAPTSASIFSGKSPYTSSDGPGVKANLKILKNDYDQDDEARGGNIDGLLTVPTFAGAFAAQGTEDTGVVFPYIMVGNPPSRGRTTTIPTNIVTVDLRLLNADGSFRLKIPYRPFEDLTLNSPVFRNADYSSGPQVQFGDAVQRAEFFNMMKRDWHTDLAPTVVDRVTFTIPRFVNIELADNSVVPVQNYYVGMAPDGNYFIELLDLYFNYLFDNATVGEIVDGKFTTFGNNVMAFPNTYLFSIDAKGNFSDCCVLGFHDYFFDDVVPQPRWLTMFSSYLSPGLFGPGFADITALSHETAEMLNDPFGDTAVPVWQFPGVPANAQVCQGNLETGDPVEYLPEPSVPVTIRLPGGGVKTFHPQTEALLQWFYQGATSNAIDGAFSYPNETVLTRSALPCPAPPAP